MPAPSSGKTASEFSELQLQTLLTKNSLTTEKLLADLSAAFSKIGESAAHAGGAFSAFGKALTGPFSVTETFEKERREWLALKNLETVEQFATDDALPSSVEMKIASEMIAAIEEQVTTQLMTGAPATKPPLDESDAGTRLIDLDD